MRIAIVYDRVNKVGGAERILSTIHSIWPEAPLYTAVYSPKGALWSHGWRVVPSFLQKFPFAATHHEFYPWATSLAFETFTFDEYDVVLSVTSAEAKSVITKPGTLHICYCLTPTRYLWSAYEEYKEQYMAPFLSTIGTWGYEKMVPVLRRWDTIAANRPDVYIAISEIVRKRIAEYYNRDCHAVIYPPVDTELFVPSRRGLQEYYLLVARMVHYKRLDIVINAFNTLAWPLVVIGDGKSRRQLQHIARGNIRFVSEYLTDQELVGYYQKCRAFVYGGEEDFGLVAAEAQACGKPVIAFKRSGIAEIVRDGKTGILYDDQTVESLVAALYEAKRKKFSEVDCRQNALRFTMKIFTANFQKAISSLYNRYSLS